MDSSRVVVVANAHRCPFCHEPVTLESDWLACRQCLARHHTACWQEANRCAACTGESALVTGTATILDGDPVAAVRRETQRAALEAARRDERTAGLLLGIGTLGVHSLLDALSAFAQHAREGDDAEEPARQIERARARATRADPARRVALVLATLVLLLPAVVLWGVAANSVVSTLTAPSGARWDDGALALAAGLQGLVWLPVFLTLHVFRESVRRHEIEQSFARLVADAVPPLVASEFLTLVARRWNARRFVDVVVSVAALVPVAGMVFVPLAGVRTRGALALHEENERLLPRRSTPAPVKC
jgi:hypothetical protein